MQIGQKLGKFQPPPRYAPGVHFTKAGELNSGIVYSLRRIFLKFLVKAKPISNYFRVEVTIFDLSLACELKIPGVIAFVLQQLKN